MFSLVSTILGIFDYISEAWRSLVASSMTTFIIYLRRSSYLDVNQRLFIQPESIVSEKSYVILLFSIFRNYSNDHINEALEKLLKLILFDYNAS